MIGWRQLWPFAALSASYFAHIGFFNPYLPLWLKESGYGLLAIGWMVALQSFTRLFAPFVWGWLSDHTGERVHLMRGCAVVALCCTVGFWFGLGPWGLALVLLLMFVHTSAMMPMSEAALAHLVSTNDGQFDARRYGRIRLWGSLGFLLTVLAAGAWFERRGMQDFPWWVTATLVAVVVSAWCMPLQHEAPHAERAHLPLWPVFRQPAVAWFFISVFLHVLSHVAIYVFFSLYIDSLGHGKSVIGLLWAVSVVVEVGWFMTQGRWLPLLRHGTWLVLAALLMAFRMAVTAGAGQWLWCLFAAQLLHSVTFAAHHSVCIAQVSRYFPGRLRGRGQALYSVLGYGLSGVLGAFAGGVISEHWGVGQVFWAACMVSLLSAAAAGMARRYEAS